MFLKLQHHQVDKKHQHSSHSEGKTHSNVKEYQPTSLCSAAWFNMNNNIINRNMSTAYASILFHCRIKKKQWSKKNKQVIECKFHQYKKTPPTKLNNHTTTKRQPTVGLVTDA